MKKSLKELITKQVLIFDGAMGSEIYKQHIFVNVCFDNLCITNADLVKNIHQSYFSAGADVLLTNSYGANKEKLKEFGLADETEKINFTAAKLAREVADSETNRICLVGGDIGPFMWNPHGESELITQLQKQISALISGGADFIIFESVSSRNSIEIAIAAMAKFDCEFVISISLNSELLTSENESLEQLFTPIKNVENLVAWGLNCSTGPESMLNALEKVLQKTNLPVIVQPNAGMPRKIGGRSLYMSSPEYFCTYAMRYVSLGAKAVGGCCGTTPQHIEELAKTIKPFFKVHYKVEEKEKKVEPKPETPLQERSILGEKLEKGIWINSVEITPPRGIDLTDTINKAKICKDAGIDLINIPDGPRASSRISALVTAIAIQNDANIETFLHVCGRDRNLIALQSDMLGCAAANVNNLLFITGDPPKLGNYPFASAVFDVDSIGLVKMQKRLNFGLDLGGESLPQQTRAVIGIGADPNALDLQRELARFREKVESGAQVVITQPVFDTDALLRFIEKIDSDYRIPVIAGVWPLASYRNAVFMQNEVPGVTVPNWILERMNQYESKEDQRKVGIEIARESLEKIRGVLSGVQVSAPFGNVLTAISVIK